MGNGFAASVVQDNGITTVGLVGELDMATAPRLQTVLDEVGGSVVIDCARLTFLDSSGIAVFVAASEANGSLTLSNVSPACRRVLEVCGLSRMVARDR